jgi:DNA-binding NtrC family response regulator
MNTSTNVLVVDDEAVIGQSFDRVLSEKGYAVSTALTGEEALNKIDEEKYDVVFTDIKMPGMDGFEVAKRIKAKCPWTPVVIITGYGTADNEAKAEVLGVSGFVRKPLTPEMIEGVTLKALRDGKAFAEAPDIVAEAAVTPETETKSAAKTVVAFTKNICLLLASPFIALAYVIALPFVGLGMLVWLGIKALTGRSESEAPGTPDSPESEDRYHVA